MAIESILIVHEDEHHRKLLLEKVSATGLDVEGTESLGEAEELLSSALYDILFLDAGLLDRPGMRTARDIRANAPDLPIVMTAEESTPSVFAAMLKLDSENLLSLPVTAEQLEVVLERLDWHGRLLNENHYLWNELARVYGYDELVGSDPVMSEVLRQATRVAQTEAAVLVHGEEGTEKELVAQYIHRSSRRSEGPLIRFCCKGVSPEHCARELFGWEDAEGKHPGRIELAADGTLHLDEIAALPLSVQTRLLGLLEDEEYQRENGDKKVSSCVRVVASTSCDPYEKMRSGELREDLFFRLNVVPIFVPPLRKRPEGIQPLANHFARKFGSEDGVEGLLEPGRWQRMQDYSWPGNVAELKNEMQLAVLRAERRRFPFPWDDDDDMS